ncbi:MAG: putative repeat protein (TIGR01451 family), partial [Thalassolituus oleivorans]
MENCSGFRFRRSPVRISRAVLANLLLFVLLVGVVGWRYSSNGAPPDTLQGKVVPLPPNLDDFVSDRDAAIRLGKALFWDMQLGADGVQTCASCHFAAGADNRIKNQMRPAGKDDPEPVFSFGGPNYTFSASDFPFAKPENEVVGSQGTFHSVFLGTTPGAGEDDTQVVPDPIFNVNGLNTRQVAFRNAPSVVNAIFGFRGLWDGRANNRFNGRTPFGPRDSDARVWMRSGASLRAERVLLDNAPMASVAVGPPTDNVEISTIGRTWPFIGKRLLTARALGDQLVDPSDSHLGSIRQASGGLSKTYKQLVEASFESHLWSDLVVRSEDFKGTTYAFTQSEENFSFFAGVSIMLYISTQVSDQSPYDEFVNGNTYALDAREQRGLDVFLNEGRCIDCHAGPDFTNAGLSLQDADQADALVNTFRRRDGQVALYDRGFFNIGLRLAGDDHGLGRDDDFGNDLSFAEQFAGGPDLDNLDVNPATFDEPLYGALNPVAVEAAIKTPGLRNIALTAPYMRNGGMATLRQVVDFFDRGGDFVNENADELHPSVLPLYLSEYDKEALVAFMLTLTDERVRLQQAPFDHPQLFVPNGHEGDETQVWDDGTGKATTDFIEIPAVGRYGFSSLPDVLTPFEEQLGVTHFDGGTTSPSWTVVDLAIGKENTPNLVAYPGDVTTYTVTLTNNSLTVAARGIEITDDLPEDFSLGQAVFGVPVNVMNTHGVYRYDAGTHTITVTDIDLAPGAVMTLMYDVAVVTPFEGAYINTATVTYPPDPDLTNNTVSYPLDVLQPIKFPAQSAVQALVACRNEAGDFHVIAGQMNGPILRSVPDGYFLGGRRWSASVSGLPGQASVLGGPPNVVVNDLIVVPNPTAGQADAVFAAVWGYAGLYRTDDCGRTWAAVDFPGMAQHDDPFKIVYAITRGPGGPAGSILYASADRGRVFRSLDGGLTWDMTMSLPGGSADTPWALAADPNNEGVLYAGTFGNGLYRSGDYGELWERTGNNGIPGDGAMHIFDLEFDPEKMPHT